MNHIGIIPCTKRKIWDFLPNIGAVQTSVAYTGPEFVLAKHYLSKYVDRIIVFSAKYGLMDLDDSISSFYDVTFSREEDPYISMEELKQQVMNKKLLQYNLATIICNTHYQKRLFELFSKTKVRVVCPVIGLVKEEDICYKINSLINNNTAPNPDFNTF